MGDLPETPISFILRNIPYIIIGTLIRFKVYLLIKGYWSLWAMVFFLQGSEEVDNPAINRLRTPKTGFGFRV